jgi:hypothetical protein
METPLKMMFTGVSQMLYCLSLMAVAGVEWRFHQDLGLHWFARPMSYLLAGLIIIALIWSVVENLKKLLTEKHWLSAGLLVGIYLSVLGLAASAFPTLILRK